MGKITANKNHHTGTYSTTHKKSSNFQKNIKSAKLDNTKMKIPAGKNAWDNTNSTIDFYKVKCSLSSFLKTSATLLCVAATLAVTALIMIFCPLALILPFLAGIAYLCYLLH